MSADPKSRLEFGDIQKGDALPELSIALTPSHIVSGAIASRDFMPVHHDKAYANQQGAPDVFMNILTTNGYVSRYVTDWAGPEAMLEKISIRLGAPALPGFTLTFTGSVLRAERREDAGFVEVELKGATEIGDHVTGTVELTLPIGG
jgi:acyl dehydratase